MLIEFRFKNYRSFRDEAVLSMEAVGLGSFKKSLIEQNNMKLLPGVAIYGKNGGGKSNVIRAFWLGVQFIRRWYFQENCKNLVLQKRKPGENLSVKLWQRISCFSLLHVQ